MILVCSGIMKKLDRKAARLGIKSLVLMENAGRGAADIVKRELSAIGGKRVTVVCGKGNNGGDGFVAARWLKKSGYDVEVYAFTAINGLKGDTLSNARIWERMGEMEVISPRNIMRLRSRLRHSSVIVDAIFGTGFSLEVKGIHRRVIEEINLSKRPVVSIDVPSGLDGTTGKTPGVCVRAAATAAMGFAKPGLFLYPGRSFSGKVEVVDIGMPPGIADGEKVLYLIDDAMLMGIIGQRKRDTHKGTYGHTLIVGGSVGKTGAVYMAAMGAMRAGSGLATIALPEGLNPIMEEKTTEVMTWALPEEEGSLTALSLAETKKALSGKSALVIGPGLKSAGDYVKTVISHCAEESIPVVVDADGLNALEGDVCSLKKAAGKSPVILTPHPGEMARLLRVTTADVQGDRVESAERLAKKTGSIVILKGAATVVALADKTFINPTGNPGMATAGTGDVLSGMLGGFLSQGVEPQKAAVLSVYIHGLAGDRVAARRGEIGLIATDLLTEVPAVLNSFVSK